MTNSRSKTSVVVTSIAAPNEILRQIAEGSRARGFHFYVIGDVPSPDDFHLDGCDFYSLDRQTQTGLHFAQHCPTRHYARKNIGYLLAMARGSECILETDDDNIPLDAFWTQNPERMHLPLIENAGWVNIYRWFTPANIWPRGLALDAVNADPPDPQTLSPRDVLCPIRQYLADDNPDVDAIYRLVLPLPLKFDPAPPVALGRGTWCPFNSQNTLWHPQAYELMYLPAFCSFRMTDIWRSFVAQRIAWENGWAVLFGPPTVTQLRNEHNLIKDFSDEIPGYLNNRRIAETLENLDLSPGPQNIPANMRTCYQALVRMELIDAPELDLLDAWLDDIARIRRGEYHP